MEDYKEKYEMALKKAKTLLSKCKRVSDKASMIYRAEDIESMFPELKEVDDEQIRKWLISQLEIKSDINNSCELELMILKSIDWLEKQGKETVSQSENNDSLINKNDALKNAIIRFFEDRYPKAMEIYDGDFTATIGQVLSWLEKQDKQNINIFWHDVSEEPEEQREIFCKWKGSNIDAVWHDVAFYHADTKTFWNGEHQIEDVIKWAYIDDMIEEQPQLYLKPKFKVGDWVAINPELRFASPLYIKDIDKSNYRVESLDGNSGTPTIDYLDNHYHLWTIEDAKDGDILACKNGWTCIFKRLNDNIFSSHCFMDSEGWFCENGGQAHVLDNSINCHPATKEQRELLFTKLKESGHEWDAVKKQLKEIEK